MMQPGSARLTPHEVAARLTPGQTTDSLMLSLLPWAASFADPSISGFVVGAIAFGGSGALYAGGNLEFAGMPLGASVHAEQAAVTNAWFHGEHELTAIAVTATPCGHCRQFMTELIDVDLPEFGGPAHLAIFVPGRPATTLADLLPAAFGARDLGIVGGLLAGSEVPLTARIDADDVLGQAALRAARASYAPYSRAYAGVALQTADGTTFTGRYAESAAYNPSLPGLQAALVDLALRRTNRGSVTAAVMVEAPARSSQRIAAEALLASIVPVPLRYVNAQRP